MKYLACFLVLIGAAVAVTCTSSNNNDPNGGDKIPTGFTFETADGTIQSIGWTGAFHGIKGAPRTSFGVKVTSCSGGVCQFVGPTAPDPQVDPTNHQRCLYLTSKICTADSDCPGPSAGSGGPQCVYLYDPPIAEPITSRDPKTMAALIGACAFTYIPLKGPGGTPSITGTLNLHSGELSIDQLIVLLGLNSVGDGTLQGVCPVCMGDASPSDGKKDGTCMVSSPPPAPAGVTGRADPGHNDQKCDVNRYGDIPGYSFGYSMDCAPTLNALTPPVLFSGSFTSSGFKISISDQSPKCGDTTFGMGNANCLCGMCSNSNTTACAADADCNGGMCVASSAPGLGSAAGNIPVSGNLCDGGVCNWNPDVGLGSCTSTKLGGMTVGCYPAATNGSKDGNGNPVSITAPGSAMVIDGVYYANTASARCTPAGPTPVGNSQVGLPGLTFQKRNFRIIPSYTTGASQ